MKDFYYILGLEINATEQQVKVAHRKLSMKFHPDKNEGDGYFTERFKEIQEAYETLSDTNKRVIYNYKLKSYKSGNGNNESLKTYEEELKRQYERELRKKEEEIRQKYQTPAQRAFEEAENARKEAETKKKAEQKRISDEIRNSKGMLAQKESVIVNLQREAVDLRNRIAHLETLMGNIHDWNFDPNKNYDKNPLSYPNILTELNRIRSEVPIQKRTVFIKAFLRFTKLHSIESNFESRHPDLVQLILQAVIKVEPFEKIHKILQKEPQLVDEFEAKVLSYVNSTSI